MTPWGYVSRPQNASGTARALARQSERGSVAVLDDVRSIADKIIAVQVEIGSTDREILHRQ